MKRVHAAGVTVKDNVAETSTWGTLIALLLGLGAALLGGLAGGRSRPSHHATAVA